MSVKFKETIQQQNGAATNGIMRTAQQAADGKYRGPAKELAHEAGEFLTRGGGAKGYLQVY